MRGQVNCRSRIPTHANDARKRAPRCRLDSLEFKLQLVPSETRDNLKG